MPEKKEHKKVAVAQKAASGAVQFGVAFVIGKLIIVTISKNRDIPLEPMTVDVLAGTVGGFINGVVSGFVDFWKMWVQPVIKAWLINKKEDALKRISEQ